MASTARIGRTISERNAIGDIDLAPGEKILFVTSRHWIVLIQRIMIPLICAAICGAIAAYRAIGGVFLLDNADISGEIDLVNTLLALAFGAILLTWVLGRRRIKLNLSRQLIMPHPSMGSISCCSAWSSSSCCSASMSFSTGPMTNW
jgi:hypothetical protein